MARPSKGPRRILIVRLSAVGDCVQTIPLACALREKFPQAHLTWVVEPIAAPLVQAVEAVDRVLVVPKHFAFSLKAVAWLRRELAAQKLDLALDPQGLSKSAFVGWLSGTPRRIGFSRPAGREISPWLQTERVRSRSVHMVDRYLELLRPLGINAPAARFGIKLPPGADVKAVELAARPEMRNGYAILNPGAGWDSKLWPLERFAQVAKNLAALGLPSVVIWGGRREHAWAEAIVARAGCAAIMAPSTSLLELAAVLRQARFVVSGDTGPLHLAAAMGTPCIGLFGASSGEACGPYGSGHIVLQAAWDRSRARKRAGADNWAMRRISVEMVTMACDTLLRQIPTCERPSGYAA